ncbi:hypothetical protein [Streptomyces ureilyticus]|uniref:Transposase (putative) YhgA-like domain-containing protein n=1 Tax=Streptomyces ureilyticus TaxID=1775131 RepID=A0ABX0DWS7_9ACTN|nr:hypothetical protein [Streptomyces ureilyticus]NGO45877.1 hypothetical protein [Streptomyces ureilyticus]
MVNSPHEAMHRIFQEYPGLFTGVSKVLGLPFVQPTSVTVLPTDLTEIQPVERRVDTLLRFDGAEPMLLAVEAQSEKDPNKPASWAYYLSFVRAKYKIPVLLLVVCQDRATAEWAAQPVSLGPPQWPALTFRPLVAGPHNMPVITDPHEARADLALATLSAVTHAKNPDVGGILKALSTALQDVPEAVADPIIEFTAQGLSGNRRATQLWRNLMAVDLSFYKSWLSEEIRDEGRAQRGAEDILLVLEARGLDVSDEIRERITACDDPDLLRRWLTRAVTAPSAEEIFTDAGEDA